MGSLAHGFGKRRSGRAGSGITRRETLALAALGLVVGAVCGCVGYIAAERADRANRREEPPEPAQDLARAAGARPRPDEDHDRLLAHGPRTGRARARFPSRRGPDCPTSGQLPGEGSALPGFAPRIAQSTFKCAQSMQMSCTINGQPRILYCSTSSIVPASRAAHAAREAPTAAQEDG